MSRFRVDFETEIKDVGTHQMPGTGKSYCHPTTYRNLIHAFVFLGDRLAVYVVEVLSGRRSGERSSLKGQIPHIR